MRIRTLEECERRYVEKSLLSFIAGRRWGQREMSIRQMVGMIRATSLRGERLAEILFAHRNFPENEEERQRFNALILELKKLAYL